MQPAPIATALQALAQSLSSGRMREEEFWHIGRGWPMFVDALSRETGLKRSEIRDAVRAEGAPAELLEIVLYKMRDDGSVRTFYGAWFGFEHRLRNLLALLQGQREASDDDST
jgi:tape measure domain-containing protein